MESDEVTYEMRQAYIGNLLADIKDISDLDYQKKAWIENSIPNICDSWEETMCQFFDDRNIDHFLQDKEDGPEVYSFTKQQTEELQKLRDLLRVYSHCKYAEYASPKSYADPREIISDPEWHKCVEQAKITLKAFEGYEVPINPA